MAEAKLAVALTGLRCRKCWTAAGPEAKAITIPLAVLVAQGESLCEDHAKTTYDALWG